MLHVILNFFALTFTFTSSGPRGALAPKNTPVLLTIFIVLYDYPEYYSLALLHYLHLIIIKLLSLYCFIIQNTPALLHVFNLLYYYPEYLRIFPSFVYCIICIVLSSGIFQPFSTLYYYPN